MLDAHLFVSGDFLSLKSHNMSHPFCDVWILEVFLKIYIVCWATYRLILNGYGFDKFRTVENQNQSRNAHFTTHSLPYHLAESR